MNKQNDALTVTFVCHSHSISSQVTLPWHCPPLTLPHVLEGLAGSFWPSKVHNVSTESPHAVGFRPQNHQLKLFFSRSETSMKQNYAPHESATYHHRLFSASRSPSLSQSQGSTLVSCVHLYSPTATVASVDFFATLGFEMAASELNLRPTSCAGCVFVEEDSGFRKIRQYQNAMLQVIY